MKKIIKVILTTCMLLTCFTMNIYADEVTIVKFYSDNEEEPTALSFKYDKDEFSYLFGYYLRGDGDYTIDESSDIASYSPVVIDGVSVSLAEGHDPIFPITINGGKYVDGDFDITTTSFGTTPVYNLPIDTDAEITSIVLNDIKNTSTLNKDATIDYEYEAGNITIPSYKTLTLLEGGCLKADESLNVEDEGDLDASQDAKICLRKDTTFSGIDLFDETGTIPITSPVDRYLEFNYLEDLNDGTWVKGPSIFDINYDDALGGVYTKNDENLELVELYEDFDDEGRPFKHHIFETFGKEIFYVKGNSNYVTFNSLWSEDDCVAWELKPDLDINKSGVIYKAIELTQKPKDDNFYCLQFNFAEDSNIRLAEKLNTLELAIDSTIGADNSCSKLKEYIANSVYEKYLVRGSRHFIDNTVFAGDDFDTFKGKVIIVEDAGVSPTKTPAQIDGTASTYFKYKLNGLDNFVGIVYKINGADKFILRDGDTYSTIDVTTESKSATDGGGAAALKDFDAVKGGRIVVRKVNNTVNREESEEVPNYEIFGNFAGFPMNYTGWMQDSQDTNYISLERVWPCAGNGIDVSAFDIGCELILYSNDFLGVCVKSSEKAKPWSKENLPIYPTNSGEEEATVFFASESIEIASPYEAPTNSTITNITFDGGLTSWNGCTISNTGGIFTITFGSIFYDKVPLQITYYDGTVKSFVIARTGLSIGDYPAPGGSDSVDVCGETVIFTDDNKWLIAAQYYYDSVSPSDRVSLFVKITENDGNVVSKLITNTINNSGIHTDDVDDYTYRKYDVFELWRGKADNRPQKIEVIAFVQGSGNEFGGVKLGSGNGIKWTQERGRQ